MLQRRKKIKVRDVGKLEIIQSMEFFTFISLLFMPQNLT